MGKMNTTDKHSSLNLQTVESIYVLECNANQVANPSLYNVNKWSTVLPGCSRSAVKRSWCDRPVPKRGLDKGADLEK